MVTITTIMNIVCDDGPDEASWCDSCDARLFERRDGSMICSNGDCGRQYPAGSVNKHKRGLEPIKNPNDNSANGGPLLISMTDYTNKKKKMPSIFDKEDKLLESRSGFYWIEHEDYWPEGNPHI